MDDDLASHYQNLVEDTRLTRSAHGRMEFLRTQELLRRYLPPPPAVVLDVGGGTGVHASWLAADGYVVHVIDPVADHVDAAKEAAGVTAAVGDARHLVESDASVDIVLLLGPLYHLPTEEERVQAIREARRVLRNGGVLFAAVISRYLSLLEVCASGRLTNEMVRSVERVISDGSYDGHVGFAAAQWHTAEDLEREMTSGGFRVEAIFGVEGPSWPVLDAVGLAQFDGLRDSALTAARLVETDPRMLHASAHLLGVGWKAGGPSALR